MLGCRTAGAEGRRREQRAAFLTLARGGRGRVKEGSMRRGKPAENRHPHPRLSACPDQPRRSRLPRGTVRLHITAIYGGLFVLSGILLLGITYLLVAHHSGLDGLDRGDRLPGRAGPAASPVTGSASQARPGAQTAFMHQVWSVDLHQLVVPSAIALAIMAVVSTGLGWLVAGRMLRPLRTMTAATRQISAENLNRRLAVTGPRDELKDLGDTIDGLLGRLEAAFDAQRRFVANVSHELRTPLAMMRTSTDVAAGKPGPVPAPVTALAAKLREGLDQADRLVDSFLELARVEHGITTTGQAVVSLPRVASSALESCGAAAADMDIEVRRALHEAEVTGSETMLARVAGNLVDNAIRHNERGGWLRVETGAEGATARLVVESGGRVLDGAKVAELAQPFHRIGADRTGSHNGVGLGLSIVAAITAAHGGRLDLRARPEGGLLVVVELPRAARGALAAASQCRAPGHAGRPAPGAAR
jgi:signal transduction histidine kinase